MLVTDVTRMGGEKVCIAGYVGKGWDSLECVRPVLPRPAHTEEDFLFDGENPIIRPFAVVELDFISKPDIVPPHTEDWIIDPDHRRFCRELDCAKRRRFLDKTASASVGEIFDDSVCTEHGTYLLQGTGARSLGTIKVGSFQEVSFSRRQDDKFDYRITFTDQADCSYRLAVTDLAFRRHCVHEHLDTPMNCEELSRRITYSLQRSSALFLRIGLARGWQEHTDRCYLQVTGIYSFPDYLVGRCFADFKPVRDMIHSEDDFPCS